MWSAAYTKVGSNVERMRSGFRKVIPYFSPLPLRHRDKIVGVPSFPARTRLRKKEEERGHAR